MTTKTNETNSGAPSDTTLSPFADLMRLCKQHADAVEALDDFTEELKSKTRKVVRAHHRRLIRLSTEVNTTRETLLEAVSEKRHLFDSPRSRQFEGIKIGFRKAKKTLNYDETTTINLIREKMPKDADKLIKKSEAVIVSAVANLSPEVKALIAVGVLPGEDKPFVGDGITDVSKVIDALITQAVKAAESE